jgi:hypothetical protein
MTRAVMPQELGRELGNLVADNDGLDVDKESHLDS